MLVRDEALQGRHEKQTAIQKTRQIAFDAGKAENKGSALLGKESVANQERQQGKGMTATAFIKKLKTINPDFVLEPHPGIAAPHESAFYKLNHDKACLHLLIGGQKIFVLVCEGDFMPEWTSMTTKKQLGPTTDPDAAWVEVEIPWYHQKRGWREVLLMLINKRLIAVTDAERVFGVGQRSSWKILTGKGSGLLLA
jgi:hypothetical protein